MRHRPSLKTKFISNRVPFLPPTEPCRWNVGTNSRSNLGTSAKMCPAGEIHGKPLARNKPHILPQAIDYIFPFATKSYYLLVTRKVFFIFYAKFPPLGSDKHFSGCDLISILTVTSIKIYCQLLKNSGR